jgi:hypothetical protein
MSHFARSIPINFYIFERRSRDLQRVHIVDIPGVPNKYNFFFRKLIHAISRKLVSRKKSFFGYLFCGCTWKACKPFIALITFGPWFTRVTLCPWWAFPKCLSISTENKATVERDQQNYVLSVLVISFVNQRLVQRTKEQYRRYYTTLSYNYWKLNQIK